MITIQTVLNGCRTAASNYNGYDMAVTDGGQYQAVVSIRQPLLTDQTITKAM